MLNRASVKNAISLISPLRYVLFCIIPHPTSCIKVSLSFYSFYYFSYSSICKVDFVRFASSREPVVKARNNQSLVPRGTDTISGTGRDGCVFLSIIPYANLKSFWFSTVETHKYWSPISLYSIYLSYLWSTYTSPFSTLIYYGVHISFIIQHSWPGHFLYAFSYKKNYNESLEPEGKGQIRQREILSFLSR